jgi:hypothetical protein
MEAKGSPRDLSAWISPHNALYVTWQIKSV